MPPFNCQSEVCFQISLPSTNNAPLGSVTLAVLFGASYFDTIVTVSTTDSFDNGNFESDRPTSMGEPGPWLLLAVSTARSPWQAEEEDFLRERQCLPRSRFRRAD